MGAKDHRDVVEALAQHEEAIAELYATYALKYPKAADLWHDLSSEEHSHAALLRTLLAQVDGVHVFLDTERFSLRAIQSSIKYVKETTEEAGYAAAGLREALAVALHLEEALIESRAFLVFETDSPRVRHVLEQLREESGEHRERLLALLHRLPAGH